MPSRHDPRGDAIRPRAMAGVRTHGLGAVPLPDRPARLGPPPGPLRTAPPHRSGWPSDDRLLQGGEAGVDLLAEDADLPWCLDAEADLAPVDLQDGHDDVVADDDPFAELARQD